MAQVEQLTPAQQAARQNEQAIQANLIARQICLSQAFDVKQQVDSQTFVPSSRSVYDVNGANVGIVKGFLLKVSARVKNNGTGVMTITPFGIANLLKQVVYYDPNNQRHIETTGWHLAMVNTIKGLKPFGASIPSDSPIKYGDNYDIIDAPQTIAAGATATVTMHYWIPLAYSDTDLTGAVFANVAQSKQRLRLEFATNSTAFVGATENPLEAVYQGASAADCVIEEMSYNCYQHYLDQLPMQNGQYIVPSIDLSTIYLLENTVVAGLTPNADFAVQYGNLYRYLSTIAIYDNGGQFGVKGADVNYLAQRTANFADYRKATPDTWNLETRKLIGTDLPSGVYLAESRFRPIYTLQTGQQTFVVNPKTVNQNARLIMAYESFVSATNLVNIGTLSTT